MTKKSAYVVFLLFLLLFGGRVHAAGMSQADSLLKASKHFSFAVQYKDNGAYDSAYAQYKKSIAFNDTVYQVHYSFGDLLMKMDLHQEAKIHYLKSLKLNPHHYNSAVMLNGFLIASHTHIDIAENH